MSPVSLSSAVSSAAHSSPTDGSNTMPICSLMFNVSHETGSLQRALGFFWKNDINMTRLSSKLAIADCCVLIVDC